MMCKVIRFEAAVRQSKTIRVICSEDFPKAKAVSTLGIYSNQGNPAACVRAGGNDYIFPLENGFQIFEFNEFLKSLNLGLKIQFINYKQYAELVAVCNQMIQKRNSGNPVILLR
ncbi:hypothetical protein JCM17207_19450 [Faecalibacterium gallinarum]|uniref:Uncharacterized protein n=1 Tax=Faecalibacterium gallinarum TaxID=2903556 RepID=A0AA37IZZ6_9FIRM|nr:hypothetical protein JCM17207_19450 [Faecalibacterium gallinarum]